MSASPVYYEGLQDKLAQIRDARGALNALREEHREKLRRAAEEAERQRQIQLAQKLEIMRQKKQVRQGGCSGAPGTRLWLRAVSCSCSSKPGCTVLGEMGWQVPMAGWLGAMVAGQTEGLLPMPDGCGGAALQEYLEMQRQLAIQRLQEQEKERQMRLEQQKQTIQMRAQMPAFSLPYAQVQPSRPEAPSWHPSACPLGPPLKPLPFFVQLQAMPPAGGVIYQPSGPTSFPGTFSPAGSVEGSPMHSVYMNQGGTGPYTAMPVAGTGNEHGLSGAGWS